MAKLEPKRIAFAFGCALLAAGFTALVFFNRDLLFEWQRVRAVGEFSTVPVPKLEASAIELAEKRIARPGAVCVGQWVGRDEKYAYMTVGCARFFEDQSGIQAEGDQQFIPTRFRYSEDEASTLEQPNLEQFGNSMRRLFPKEAMNALPGKNNLDLFFKLGLARQKAVKP